MTLTQETWAAPPFLDRHQRHTMKAEAPVPFRSPFHPLNLTRRH